ncbi:ABA4-like family protein [Egibacter rhizosphaerae]|uniref:ABA4-like family protein n=1 Tax=Egibacter rhizosphaerae TaxID=1670831 RepID=UPI0013F17C5A|nr:ABA4-like family protein [Egibacter rhizosphaerae]
MTVTTAFSASFLLVAPVWALMLAAPRWWLTRRLLASPLVAVPAAAAYAVAVAPIVGDVLSTVTRPELGAVAALLAEPRGALVAWAHFLAFDLLVGRWIYLDARAWHVPHFVVLPVLLLTLLLGPVGYLLHVLTRAPFRAGDEPGVPAARPPAG